MKPSPVFQLLGCTILLALGCSESSPGAPPGGVGGQLNGGTGGSTGGSVGTSGAPAMSGSGGVDSGGAGGSVASAGSGAVAGSGGSGGGAAGTQGVAGSNTAGSSFGGTGGAMGAHPDCPNCVSIFDGQTLDGWQPIGGEEWEVDDTGAIFSTGESAGALVTVQKFERYRLIFSWQWLGSDHQANMLIWCRDVGARNCAGVQFQPPGRDVWDYGPANRSIRGLSDPPLSAADVPKGEEGMCELLVDSAAGTFKGGCCPLNGEKTCKTSPSVNLTYGSALPPGELGFQAHNADHRIRWWDIFVEEDPVGDELVTQE